MTVRVSPERSGGVSETLVERRRGGRLRLRIERVGEIGIATMLVVFVLAAPHSIAVTQGAFIAGMAFWVLCGLAVGALGVTRTPIDLPLAFFIGWTVVSTALSEA